MKQFYFVALLLLLLSACNSDKKSAGKPEDKDTSAKTMAPMDEKTRKIEELKKKPPLTLEQLRTLLPTEFDSVKEKNYFATAQFGYALTSVEYPKNNKTRLKVTLIDCAGEYGSSFYLSNYWNNLNVANENGEESTKTIDFMGGKAIENYKRI